jgi:iron complex transport system permease protein
MVVAGKELHMLIFWLMGGFSHGRWPYVYVATLVIIPCIILTFLFSRRLNLLLLSEEEAQQLGVDVTKSIKGFLVLGSLLTAAAVSTSGSIGFIGLIIPHMMRILVGPDHRILLPSSILAGTIFLTLCDILARVVFMPTELPVGVITALTGGPFFLYLLRKGKGSYVF